MQTAIIPFGGNDITRDIATHFGFNEERAEKLKVVEGNLATSLAPQILSDTRLIMLPHCSMRKPLNMLI